MDWCRAKIRRTKYFIKRDLLQLHRMSLRHKQMCRCEICISIHSLHKSLNGFRQRLAHSLTIPGTQEQTKRIQTYKDTMLPNGESCHKKQDMPSRKYSVCQLRRVATPTGNVFFRGVWSVPNTQFLLWRPLHKRGVNEFAKTVEFHP
jgi:hypothetical protein